MDQELLDRLSQHCASMLNRRSLAGVAGWWLGAWAMGPASTEAKKKKKKKKKPQPPCTPVAASQTCAGKCGSVTNNCQQQVTCSPCSGCTGLAPTADLQAAVTATGTGATLALCEGTWTPPMQVDLNRNMTIRGAGIGKTILDGRNLTSLLLVNTDTVVTVENLTIANGKARNGGGVYIRRGTLHLRNAEVTGCEATDFGGGILNNGWLELHDGSHVHDNVAASDGGGIQVEGFLTMHDGSRVTGNSADGFGGGIGAFSSQVTLKAGSRVSGNQARSGGGIANLSGTVTLQSGSLVGGDRPEDANVATFNGGGLYGYTMILEDGSQVTGNQADMGGGCFVDDDWTFRAGSRVSGNTARTGGGIYRNLGDVTFESGVIVCDNVPLGDQCYSLVTHSCPNPGNGVCPA